MNKGMFDNYFGIIKKISVMNKVIKIISKLMNLMLGFIFSIFFPTIQIYKNKVYLAQFKENCTKFVSITSCILNDHSKCVKWITIGAH